MLDVLPPPLTVEPDSVLVRLLEVAALEMDVLQEDLERVRQTHWIRSVFRLLEAEKLGALLDIERLPGESLALYRERLVATAVARRQGANGAPEIRRFVYDYLYAAERALDAVLVPGLRGTNLADAYSAPAERPHFRPLALVEWPHRRRTSATLRARGGKVPYLFRWSEDNRGLDESVVELDVRGAFGGATAVPVLVNTTTGDLIGFRDRLRFGQRLRIVPAAPGEADGEGSERLARAILDESDATDRLFSVSGFELGKPFAPEDLDPAPQLPRLLRGGNNWIYLSVAHYDVEGLNRSFLAIAGAELREGVFNETGFDSSLFPSGSAVWLSLSWSETEAATFAVRVPWAIVAEPTLPSGAAKASSLVDTSLRSTVFKLHAAGVTSRVELVPFTETQNQIERFELPFRVLDPERGPSGEDDRVALGGRFGDSATGRSLFE
jgi:hypothetical protein